MPFLDRYWWLRPILAVVILIVPGEPMKQLLDDGLLSSAINRPLDHIGEILYFGLASLFFLAIAVAMTVSTYPARRRKLRRLAALNGNPEAIPRALVVYQNVEYDLAERPVVIEEQLSKSMRGLFIFAALPLLLICLIGIIALIALFIADVEASWSAGHLAVKDIPRTLFVLGFGVAIVWGAILASRYLPTILGRPYGVTLGPNGVSYRSEYDHRTFLRWDEMRLFEVSGTPLFGRISPVYEYRLYGLREAVCWRDTLVYPTVETGPTPSSTPGGTALAVTIIRDRTGLPPRTFVKALQAREQPSASSPVGVSQLR